METIISPQNQKIKNYLKLLKSNNSKKQDLVACEGAKEVRMAIEAGMEIVEIFLNGDIDIKVKDNKKLLINDRIAEKISRRESPAKVFAVLKRKTLELSAVKLSNKPFVIIAEDLEKPGNIGAIIRTVDAVGADALLLANPRTDIYNHNVIRTSRGAVFSTQIAGGSNKEVLEWLKKNKIKVIISTPETDREYTKIDYKQPAAILVGTEHEGLSDFWLKNADKKIKIPMNGQIDSLNASVSTAVIAYEVLRQRKKNQKSSLKNQNYN